MCCFWKGEWRKKPERNKLIPDTFEGYICRANVLNYIFGKKLISEILLSDITNFQDDELNRNSLGSANRHLINIEQVFKLASAFGGIVEDPIEDTKCLRRYELAKYYRNGMCYNEVG